MTNEFSRLVAVVGLPWPGLLSAEKYLHRQGLAVESLRPTPDSVEDFLKRGGLCVWIEAPLRVRLGRWKWNRMRPERRVLRAALEAAELGRAKRHRPAGDEVCPEYAWHLAQVVVHRGTGLVRFRMLLRQLAAELTYPEHLPFMQYDEELVPRTSGVVGEEAYQVYVLGARRPGVA